MFENVQDQTSKEGLAAVRAYKDGFYAYATEETANVGMVSSGRTGRR